MKELESFVLCKIKTWGFDWLRVEYWKMGNHNYLLGVKIIIFKFYIGWVK